MELPFEKTVCRYWNQKLYNLVNKEETQEVKLPESMPDIGRVISSWGQVIIRGKDWRTSSVGVNGGVMVWVIYAPEGGGPLERIESWIPFQCRADLPDSSDDGTIRLEAVLRNVDARNVSSRKLMLRAGIGLLIQALVPKSTQISQPGELPEDVEQLLNTYPIMLTRETGEKSFLMDEELALPAGLPNVEKLIYFRMEPEVLEQKVMGQRAVFRGQGNLHVLYMDPDQKLCGQDFEVPFAQYVELDEEFEPEAQISTVFAVTSLELDPIPEGGLRLKCGMVGQYIINAPTVISVLEDAYSPCRDVELDREPLDLPAWLEDKRESIALTECIPAEDSVVIDQTFFPDLPGVTHQPGAATVECGGSFQALVQNKDGSYAARTVRPSAQYHHQTACDTVCFAWPRGNVSCRKEGSSWRFDTQMALDVRSLCTQPMEMVSGVKLGEAREPDPERPSIIIRAKDPGQSLWNLAKASGSTVGAIRKMNRLEGEPEDKRLLLIPVI